MRTIICKRCGAQIDAELGVCPSCGAVYYILSEEEKPTQSASPDYDAKLWEPSEKDVNDIFNARNARDAELLNNDIFNTHVIKTSGGDETQVFRPVREETLPQQPVRPAPRPQQASPRPQYAPRAEMREYTRQSSAVSAPSKSGLDNRKKQLIVAGAALLALLTLVLCIMGGVFSFGGKDSENTMPLLEGWNRDTAISVLERMKAAVTVEEEFSDAPIDTVIRQSVKEGEKVKKGTKITIVVSKGLEEKTDEEIEYIEVPSLTGMTYDQARRMLTEMGLAIRRGEDVYSDKDEGEIVDQTPYKGAKLEKGEVVEVVLSMGPEPSPSPESHTITVTAGTGGSISPKGLVMVENEKDQTFTITPDEGYEIREVKVDGTSIGAVESYTFTKVTGDHAIYAVFQKKPEPTPTPTPTPSPESTPVSGTDETGASGEQRDEL